MQAVFSSDGRTATRRFTIRCAASGAVHGVRSAPFAVRHSPTAAVLVDRAGSAPLVPRQVRLSGRSIEVWATVPAMLKQSLLPSTWAITTRFASGSAQSRTLTPSALLGAVPTAQAPTAAAP